jgi:hypothetical protein
MKFSFACTFERRGETPAPPEKRSPALPRLLMCRALFRQIGTRIFRAGCSRHLASGGQTHGGLIARCARHPDWAVSHQRARSRSLGGFGIWSGYLERRVAARRPHACLPGGTAKHRGVCWRTQERLVGFKQTGHYASRRHVKIPYISCRRLSWLMRAWLTRVQASIFTAFSRDFCYSALEFYCLKTPLNITEYFVLTDASAKRHRPGRMFFVILQYVARLTLNQRIRATLLQNRTAPFWPSQAACHTSLES